MVYTAYADMSGTKSLTVRCIQRPVNITYTCVILYDHRYAYSLIIKLNACTCSFVSCFRELNTYMLLSVVLSLRLKYDTVRSTPAAAISSIIEYSCDYLSCPVCRNSEYRFGLSADSVYTCLSYKAVVYISSVRDKTCIYE